MTAIATWKTFFKERLPLIPLLIISAGYAFTGMAIRQENLSTGHLWAMGAATLAIVLFMGVLRLMDEIKDKDKDAIVHPDRPLPRGLVTEAGLRRLIGIGYGALLLATPLFGWWSFEAGWAWLATILWMGLMYREFFLGEWLENRPWLYAISHQVVIPLLALFTVSIQGPGALREETLSFGLLALGAFFNFEICRKLQPDADPILGTYLVNSGRLITWMASTLLMALAAWGAWRLGLALWLWPVQIIMVLIHGLLGLAPHRYKVVEGIASVALLAQIWAGLILFWQ